MLITQWSLILGYTLATGHIDCSMFMSSNEKVTYSIRKGVRECNIIVHDTDKLKPFQGMFIGIQSNIQNVIIYKSNNILKLKMFISSIKKAVKLVIRDSLLDMNVIELCMLNDRFKGITIDNCGPLSSFLGKCMSKSNLYEINIVSSDVTDTDIIMLAMIPKLHALSLYHCNITTEKLFSLGHNFSSLARFGIVGGNFSYKHLSNITQMIPSLSFLKLNDIDIDDRAIDYLLPFNNITVLSLNGTNITNKSVIKLDKLNRFMAVSVMRTKVDNNLVLVNGSKSQLILDK